MFTLTPLIDHFNSEIANSVNGSAAPVKENGRMKWFIGILILLMVGAAFPLIMSRMSNSKRSSTEPKGDARRNSYKAISISPCEDCCQAVADAAEKLYLVDKIMRLPVEGCDRIAQCSCTFRHHPDRRDGDDRRNPVGALSAGHIGMKHSNQRADMDRRSGLADTLDDF